MIRTEVLFGLIGLVVTAFKIIFDAIKEVKAEIKAVDLFVHVQDKDILNNKHRIDLIEHDLDSKIDVFTLTTNGLVERITHDRVVLEQKIADVRVEIEKKQGV